MTRLPGRGATLADPPEVFRAAGRAIAELHALPCIDTDPLPLSEAIVRRAHSCCERAERRQLDGRAVVARVAGLGGERVWCHRDNQPQNWLVYRGTVALVDFEHCRADHPLTDWVRLEARGWSDAQSSAYADGYGGRPDPDEAGAWLALYGLETVCWARDNRDVALEHIGWAALDKSGVIVPGTRVG